MKATKMFPIWLERGYLQNCFEYRTASEGYLVAEIFSKPYGTKNQRNMIG